MCARILRRDIDKLGYTRSFTIYDEDDQSVVLKELLKHFNIDDKMLTIRELKGKISDSKEQAAGPGRMVPSEREGFSLPADSRYLRRLRKAAQGLQRAGF